MPDLRIRRVDDRVVAELKAQAKRKGHTLGEELREVLTDAAWRPRQVWVKRLREHHEAIRKAHGTLPDSTPIIREERDRLG